MSLKLEHLINRKVCKSYDFKKGLYRSNFNLVFAHFVSCDKTAQTQRHTLLHMRDDWFHVENLDPKQLLVLNTQAQAMLFIPAQED